MAVITGIRGLLNGVALFRDWSVTETANLKDINHASVAEGGKQRFVGIQDWNGTANAYGLEPDFYPGDSVNFLGSIDGSVGLDGDCLVTQVVITIPIGADDPPTIAYTFRGDEALTRGAAVVADPATLLMPPSVRGLCPLLSNINVDSPAYTEQANVYNITITLTIDVAEFNDCSSNGIQQVKETTWDASVSYDQYVDDFDDLIKTATSNDIGTAFNVRIPIDDPVTEYFEFQWLRASELSNMQVNRETGDLVSATCNFELSALEEIGSSSPTVTKGQVLKPDTTVWRPDASAPYTLRRLTTLEQGAIALEQLAKDGKVSPEVAARSAKKFETVVNQLKAKGIDPEARMAEFKAAEDKRKKERAARKQAVKPPKKPAQKPQKSQTKEEK